MTQLSHTQVTYPQTVCLPPATLCSGQGLPWEEMLSPQDCSRPTLPGPGDGRPLPVLILQAASITELRGLVEQVSLSIFKWWAGPRAPHTSDTQVCGQPPWHLPHGHHGWQHGTCRCTSSQQHDPGCSAVPGRSQCTLGHVVLPETPRAGHPQGMRNAPVRMLPQGWKEPPPGLPATCPPAKSDAVSPRQALGGGSKSPD